MASDEIEGDDDDARPFTSSERKAIRKMLDNEERVAWLWASARVWIGWGAAFIIGTAAVHQALQGWFPGFFRKIGP